MAIRIRIFNTVNNNTIAVRDIPDAALPRLQAVYGTAQHWLDQTLAKTRQEVLETQVNEAKLAVAPQLQAAETTERAAFETDWPA